MIENKNKPPLIIRCEAEFEALMVEIDREMVEEKVPIPARSLKAGLKITKKFDVVLNSCPTRRAPKEDDFSPEEVSIRIHDWFDNRYGDRLKVPFQIGRLVLPLRGALYVANCPMSFGKVQMVCEPHTFGQRRSPSGGHVGTTYNILDAIEDMTEGLATSLDAAEIIKICIAFVAGVKAHSKLRVIADVERVHEVYGDLEAAVFHLTEHRPHFGLSKWASLQAVEKLVKVFIREKTGSNNRGHDLQSFFDQAEPLGLPKPPTSYINNIQCPAGVRYGEVTVDETEALKAHLCSLEVIDVVAHTIGHHLQRAIPVIGEPLFDGLTIEQFLRRYQSKPSVQ